MRRCCAPVMIAMVIAMLGSSGLAQQASTAGPYKIVKVAKVGGDGGFDYVYADTAGRRLYVPRSGPTARITVFDLDTLEPAGEVPNVNGHGAVVDPKTNHGFVTSNPVLMFDSKTLAVIKTINVQGNPDGILFDPYNERVYDLSHSAPNATVIDAKDGSIVGTIDLGGRTGTSRQRRQRPHLRGYRRQRQYRGGRRQDTCCDCPLRCFREGRHVCGVSHRRKKSRSFCSLPRATRNGDSRAPTMATSSPPCRSPASPMARSSIPPRWKSSAHMPKAR